MVDVPDGVVEVCSFTLGQACEAAIGLIMQVSEGGYPNFQELLAVFAAVAAPRTCRDAVQSAFLFFHFKRRAGIEIHRRIHGGQVPASCVFNPARYPTINEIDQLRPDAWRAESVFRTWQAAFGNALRLSHPALIAERTKQILKSRLREPMTVAAVAREVGCSVPVLQRQFSRVTGHSVHRYAIALRVDHAIHLLRQTDWKVEAVAREVGWRSKKDLHAALRRALAMTPNQVRRLPEGKATALCLRSDEAAMKCTSTTLNGSGR